MKNETLAIVDNIVSGLIYLPLALGVLWVLWRVIK